MAQRVGNLDSLIDPRNPNSLKLAEDELVNIISDLEKMESMPTPASMSGTVITCVSPRCNLNGGFLARCVSLFLGISAVEFC
jgi:hypothetical protein